MKEENNKIKNNIFCVRSCLAIGILISILSVPLSTNAVKISSIQKGLIGHWMLDSKSKAKDLTPYGNNGTGAGGITLGGAVDQKGQANNATTFDGSGNIVSVAGTFNSKTIKSVSLWAKSSRNSANNDFLRLSRTSGESGSLIIAYSLNTSYVGVYNGTSIVNLATAPSINVWHHFVFLFSDTQAKVIIDGVDKGWVNFTLANFDANLAIGYNGGVLFYTGDISDFRIYNRELSTTEITQLYNAYRPKIKMGAVGIVPFKLSSYDDNNPNLVAGWRMDENAGIITKDVSGNGNTGTISGATWVKTGGTKALSFDGIASYVKFGDILDTTFTGANKKFSMSAWIKPASIMTSNMIISKTADGGLIVPENQRQLFFRLTTDSKLNFVWYGSLILPTSNKSIIGTTQITNTNKWYHVVATYDGTLAVDSRVSLYVDGIQESISVSGSGSPTSIPDGTAQMGVGAMVNTAGDLARSFFNGLIDEVRVYSKALTTTEITNLYTIGKLTH